MLALNLEFFRQPFGHAAGKQHARKKHHGKPEDSVAPHLTPPLLHHSHDD
jgi:hypothetical protein